MESSVVTEAYDAVCQAEKAVKSALSTNSPTVGTSMAALESSLQSLNVLIEEEDSPAVVRAMRDKLALKSQLCKDLRLQVDRSLKEQTLARRREEQKARSNLLALSAEKSRDGEKSTARREMLHQAELIAKSKDITASLRRTKQMVEQELERMAAAEQRLAEDAKVIQSTAEGHASYRNSANQSAAVLKEIQRQERIDKIVVAVAFSIFLLIVIIIVWKRTIGWFF